VLSPAPAALSYQKEIKNKLMALGKVLSKITLGRVIPYRPLESFIFLSTPKN